METNLTKEQILEVITKKYLNARVEYDTMNYAEVENDVIKTRRYARLCVLGELLVELEMEK